MTDFKQMYESKRMSAQQIAEQVQDGWLMCIDAAVSHPTAILSAISERAKKRREGPEDSDHVRCLSP